VSRYDGSQFITFSQEDGLANNDVKAILEDREGHLWFGTRGGGVSRYDGKEFITFSMEDGLVHNTVWSIMEDRKGILWFGTAGGVNRYDGFVFQNLVREQQQRIEVQQQLMQELEQANEQIQEATQHKSAFLARMSHDLRTPMNAIIGYTRILRRRAKEALNDRQYHNLENIQTSADHLLSLINDVLDLSRVEAGRIDIQPEHVDLKQLAEECLASVESLVPPNVRLERQLEDVTPVHTDADRLRRVIMNLLSNAVKFTEEGSIMLSLRSVDEWVELSVVDTGMGIPPEDLPHIFDEFRQGMIWLFSIL